MKRALFFLSFMFLMTFQLLADTNCHPPNSTVMLYKRNCIPYIAPLVLQNTTINKSQYVIASDIIAGKSVDNNRTNGQVTVTGEIEYEVEHTGEVRLCGGFKVDRGVKFSIKPSNYNK